MTQEQCNELVEHWLNAERWATHLKTKNRFFLPPALKESVDRVVELIRCQITEDFGSREYWRARINDGNEPFDVEHMGAPPCHKTKGGRINPEGIPYLYLSDSKITAISEIRPSIGDYVSVACFKLVGKLKIADLRINSLLAQHVLPPTAIAIWEECNTFLEASFSKPVPDSTNSDYVPSQYFSATLMHNGYDGIVYKSVLHTGGYNLALFKPDDAAKPKDDVIENYKIWDVVYTPHLESCE